MSVAEAEQILVEFLTGSGIEVVPITMREAETALAAFDATGKAVAIGRNLISEIASPTRPRRTIARLYWYKARISPRLIFAPAHLLVDITEHLPSV